ncbi:MAG: sugar phosphate nucleotidyltransferase [bacterium]
MKLVIFAGGVGTRLWPLSRENSPKQFHKIFAGKSTLQLAFDRVSSAFPVEDICVQTVAQYIDIVHEQLPKLPRENIFIEPARRNLGPAVCFTVMELKKRGFAGPMAILWSDHLMENSHEFVKALQSGEEIISERPESFVFLGEKPRFANNNLGWIKVGQKIGMKNEIDYFEFAGWKYRPPAEDCCRMFESGEYYWNPGYFITSIEFLEKEYRLLAPNIYNCVESEKYDDAESISFDNAILEKVDLSNAVVIKTNMDWSDPGTLYAFKEALGKSNKDNVVEGLASSLNTVDSLIYNTEEGKLVAAVGLDGMVVVNTDDVLIVAAKDHVVHITELIKKLKEEGKEKYL